MEDSAEKARLYDLIIDRAKKELDACGSPTCDTASLIFKLIPELNIDEDERIIKWIINEIKTKHHNLDEDNVDFVDKAIAWVEKQGKQSLPTTNERAWALPKSD